MVMVDWDQAARQYRDFYAPEYSIEVEGESLDPTTKGDVLDLKVSSDIEQLGSFDITLNNWDDTLLLFKYSDTSTFDVGKVVHVRMGYADRLVPMVVGQITTMRPSFPESGSPTIAISGLDGMLRLRDRKPKPGEAVNYFNKADWQIAQVIAQRNGLRAEVTREGPTHALVVQKNQDDASFLMERAKRIDFDCFILADPNGGQASLHFVRPSDGRDTSRPSRTYELTWGLGAGGARGTPNLIQFTPQLTLSRQVSAITVRGWDPATKSPIECRATRDDLPGQPRGGTSGPQAAERNLQGKQDVVVDAPVLSVEEARHLAQSLLRERAYEFVTGSGRIVGLPDLRAGDNLEIQGLGRRFSGTYYVKKAEHSLGGSGFFTQFDVRRVFDGGERS